MDRFDKLVTALTRGIGGVLIFGAGCILASQCILWLRDGVWYSADFKSALVEVENYFGQMSWSIKNNPTGWAGFNRILDWFLSQWVGFYLIAAGVFLIRLPDMGEVKPGT